jgi:predicted TIM-barrel fold metal-dependent hydrolase
MATMMLRGIGMPADSFERNFDALYVEHLLARVQNSSLGAAMILAHDEVYNERGQRMDGAGSFYVPNDYVLRLAREHAEFLPAVSIHPARPDAMEELERCLTGGAVAMKCLPNCHNIDCNDRRFTKFWERMAAAGLPLLAHTGGEHTVPVIRPELGNPEVLTLPLECGVTVIAAHCATKSGLTDPEYFFALLDMFKRYPNLYGDVSAFNVPLRGRHVRECLKAGVVERMIHGSDYPVPVSGIWAWLRGFIGRAAWRASANEPNVIERDYQLKVAMGFPPEVFTRGWKLLKLHPGK